MEEFLDDIRRAVRGSGHYPGTRRVVVDFKRGARDEARVEFSFDSAGRDLALRVVMAEDRGFQRVGYKQGARGRLAQALGRYAERAAGVAKELMTSGFEYAGLRSSTPLSQAANPPSPLERRGYDMYAYSDVRLTYEIARHGIDFRQVIANRLAAEVRSAPKPEVAFLWLAIAREDLLSVEDLGAALLSVQRAYRASESCNYQRAIGGGTTPFCYTYLNYAPGEALLSRLLEKAGSDRFHLLGFDALVPSNELGGCAPNVVEKALRWIADEYLPYEAEYGGMLLGARGLAKTKHGCPIVGDTSVVPMRPAFGALTYIAPHASKPSKASLDPFLPMEALPVDERLIEGTPELLDKIAVRTDLQRLLIALHLVARLRGAKPPGVLGLGSMDEFAGPIVAALVPVLNRIADSPKPRWRLVPADPGSQNE